MGHGCTTGISAHDRAKTVQALIDPEISPEELGRPGHIFPLKAKTEGVLRRSGHTEAAIDFARLAGFEPAGCIVEIMNEDGTMARLNDLYAVADKFDLKVVSIADLINYRLQNDSSIKRKITVNMPTDYGNFDLVAYEQIYTKEEHLALIKGSWEEDEPVLVRVHSSCVTGDIFGSCRCDCGEQLKKSNAIGGERRQRRHCIYEPGGPGNWPDEQTSGHISYRNRVWTRLRPIWLLASNLITGTTELVLRF